MRKIKVFLVNLCKKSVFLRKVFRGLLNMFKSIRYSYS